MNGMLRDAFEFSLDADGALRGSRRDPLTQEQAQARADRRDALREIVLIDTEGCLTDIGGDW